MLEYYTDPGHVRENIESLIFLSLLSIVNDLVVVVPVAGFVGRPRGIRAVDCGGRICRRERKRGQHRVHPSVRINFSWIRVYILIRPRGLSVYLVI